MFETVVVGADGSPTAAKAVEAAIELVKLSDGTLHIVTATVQGDSRVHSVPTELASRARAHSVTVETHDREGDPADVVQAVAEQVGADLIVVGSQGMKRRVLGSVPNSIAHGAPCAVLVVKTD